MQVLALVPGVSRSGATISGGLIRGLDRVTATRLSFLLGIPALLGAGVFELPDALSSGVGWGPTLVGTVVSFVVAYAHHRLAAATGRPTLDRDLRLVSLGAGSRADHRAVVRLDQRHVTTLVLLRHGRSTANGAGVLAGRTEGVDLDEAGAEQARGLVERLSGVRVARLVSSPLLRCRRTIDPLAETLGLPVELDDRITEVDYGVMDGPGVAGPGRRTALADRAGPSRRRPSSPTGRGWRRYRCGRWRRSGSMPQPASDDGVAVLCSHGDVIKAILADALGMHLDGFQRIVVAPASISVVRYTTLRPFVERINDTGTLRGLGAAQDRPAGQGDRPDQDRPRPGPTTTARPDAAPGGDAGPVTVPGGGRRRGRRDRRRTGCWPKLKSAMSRQVHVFRSPDRFLAGTIGQPGEREFFLQVVDGRRVLSVACEKQQVAVLADRLGSLITEVGRRFGEEPGQGGAPVIDDDLILTTPVDAEFRVGTMGLAWDGEGSQVIVELLALTEEEVGEDVVLEDREDGPDALRVFLSLAEARDFARHAQNGGRGGSAAMPAVREPAGPGRPHLPAAERVPPRCRGLTSRGGRRALLPGRRPSPTRTSLKSCGSDGSPSPAV